MLYELKVNRREVPEDQSFSRKVKVMVKGDVRFEYVLDERDYTYSVPVEAGQEVRVDYHEQGAAADYVMFTAGDDNFGFTLKHYSILLDGHVEVTPEPEAPELPGFPGVAPLRDEDGEEGIPFDADLN